MPYRTLLLCFLFAVVSLDAPASSAETSRWQGLWQTADEWGSAYTIDIRADGTATADYGDGWVGRWHKEYGNNVVIEWNSGWRDYIFAGVMGLQRLASRQGQRGYSSYMQRLPGD